MALVAISTLFPDIVPYVAGAPSPLIRQAVRNAAREFCIDTLAWRANLTAINVVAAQSDYTLTPPASSAIVEVISARYIDEPLGFLTEQQLDIQFPRWRTDIGTPEIYTILSTGVMTLIPQPPDALAAGLSVRVALMPSISATSIDDSLTTRWITNIAAGALAILKGMPDQPWTALGQVDGYYGLFLDGIRKAKTAVASSLQSRPRRTVRYGGL